MRQRIPFDEDIALKRYAYAEHKPRFNWSNLLDEESCVFSDIKAEMTDCHQGFNEGRIAETIGCALTDLMLSRNQKDIYNRENCQFVALIARDVSKMLRHQIRVGEKVQFSEHEIDLIIEKILIERNAYDVALSLVQNRARGIKEGGSLKGNKANIKVRLIRRNAQVVPWDQNKIEIAVRKAFLFLQMDSEPAVLISEAVTQGVSQLNQAFVHIEDVQDMVQEILMRMGYFKVAEAYILYRAHRAQLREDEVKEDVEDGYQGAMIMVKSENDDAFFWNGSDLRKRIEFAIIGLNLCIKVDEIEVELRRSLYAEMSPEDLKKTIILNARSLVERDADFGRFAGRILLTYIYEEVLGWDIVKDGVEKLKLFHRRHFRKYIERSVEIGRLAPGMLDLDLDRIAKALDYSADLDFDYLGIQTLYDRYLIVDKTGHKSRRLETPQLFWMRVAMGLFYKEKKDAEEWIIKLYRLYKDRRFCSSTPTLFNSGTCRSQLSSCFLYKVDDNIESIMYRGIAENAFLSKWAGGLGGSWTSVRGTGGHIHGTNGESQGVIPFLKLHNDLLIAVNQGGKRHGAGCAYLETWHNDIIDFLELRRNTGDDRRRAHDMNTANWIPDLFMKRMEAREDWTLFNPGQTPDLHGLYGKAFEERYCYYEKEAEAGKIFGKKMPAIDLWKKMLGMLFETGHPWITFKDPCNIRNPQDHAGAIYSSNLCTEITLNTGAEETAVCNLGSIILENHLDDDGNIDHKKLRQTVGIAVRALDNVIDINFYPTKAAETANSRHRPIGLGVMGLQNALYAKGISFASEEAVEFNDEFMEAIAYYAYEASSDLAGELGTYSSYKGSKWDRGLMPQDTLDLLEKERGVAIDVPRGGKMDWKPLRQKIAKQGMRNSNVLAIAPTATISNIMRTSPCIEPTYKNLFVKSNLSGEFIVLNEFLVRGLKKRGLWSQEMLDQLKYFDGELADIAGIPDDLKQEYLTAFAIPFEYFIRAAARRQKWIDQSQSVNLFLGSADLKILSHMYRAAWHQGLKTTYYLRTLGASNIEKATVSVKKEVRGIVSQQNENDPKAKSYIDAEIKACSIEALLNGGVCEACQ